jgi:hypothetical protein
MVSSQPGTGHSATLAVGPVLVGQSCLSRFDLDNEMHAFTLRAKAKADLK